MLFLTIETTCDETAAAVVNDRLEVLGSAIATQDRLHEIYGGVVPELASRAHVERILPVIDHALRQAGCQLSDLGCVAVATTPGLAGSLLVGLSAAKALCVALGVPLVAVDHLQAHIYACRMAANEDVFPCVGMVVSGGHSSFYRCDSPVEFTLLGGTIDDAAGEAFDKVAAMLGLPYPGGPAIERAAAQGDSTRWRFPRPLVDEPQRLEFSFSGLKTAVRYAIAGPGGDPSAVPALSAQHQADLAASFQEAVVDVLVAKAGHALDATGLSTLCVGGGVGANGCLRDRLTTAMRQRGVRLIIAPPAWCTDNAVMGAIAVERWRAGLLEPLDLDAAPGLVRARRAAK